MSNLTENEKKVIRAIGSNCFNILNYDTPDTYEDAGAPIWTHSINDAGEPSGIEGKALSGVCSSLVKKGFIISVEEGPESTVQLTELGFNAGFKS